LKGHKKPRILFGHKREELTGRWRYFCNYELQNLCSSPDITAVKKLRRMKYAGLIESMVRMRNYKEILVGNPAGKRSLWRLRYGRADDVKN
jgi:hypothetical protein